MLLFISLLTKYCNSNTIVTVELDVLVVDLEFAHTHIQDNRSALLIGSQHTYAWRGYGKGTKLYWYHNTAI